MNAIMRYKELFQITVKHPYYGDHWKDIEIYPDSRTEKLMRTLKVFVKSMNSGFNVLAPVSEDNHFFKNLQKLRECKFLIYPSDSTFIQVTNLKTDVDGEILHFTNEGLMPESTQLKIESTVHQSKNKGYEAVGVITVDFMHMIEENKTHIPKYEVVFDSQAVVWKYYFIHNTEDADFEISSREQQPSFSQMHLESDAIAETLKVKFPESFIVGFQSDEAIPYSKKPVKDLKLNQKINDYSIGLPNPEIGRQGIQILNINNKV